MVGQCRSCEKGVCEITKHIASNVELTGEYHADCNLLIAECNAKQAKIDELMLEYCPDEMTTNQIREWKITKDQ